MSTRLLSSAQGGQHRADGQGGARHGRNPRWA